MSDKKITCPECGIEFTFTVGEQEWFQERNLVEPKYCSDCRKKRKERREAQNHDGQHFNRQENDQKAA
ncbi:MAG: cytochrome C551 [Bacilli bacterium]|nr:cytochrome C551 [Bacilli bacterium]